MTDLIIVSLIFNVMQFVVMLALIGEARRAHDTIERQQERIQELMSGGWQRMEQGSGSVWLWILIVVALVIALFVSQGRS